MMLIFSVGPTFYTCTFNSKIMNGMVGLDDGVTCDLRNPYARMHTVDGGACYAGAKRDNRAAGDAPGQPPPPRGALHLSPGRGRHVPQHYLIQPLAGVTDTVLIALIY